MSDVRTIWHEMEAQRSYAASRQRSGILLVVLLLCTMGAAEVLFLRDFAGPDSVALIQSAEGIAITE